MALSINYKKRAREYSDDSHSQSQSSRSKRSYDVFLSFRGEDTRNNFVGHLYKALDRYGIYTFKDDEKLEKGKTVGPELLKSIEESKFSIVILSRNYANSSWCLDELVQIIQCMDQNGQTVLPIFYNVDPSDVRKQSGNFEKDFNQHEKTFEKEKEKVLRWREAFRRVGSIAGSDSRNRDESTLIEKIVRDISDKLLSESSSDHSKLVGMSRHVEQMKSLLCYDGLNEVLMVGIWGMGGIGKTTISKVLYDKYSHLYDAKCYIENVKDIFIKAIDGPSYLREKLLSGLFMDTSSNFHNTYNNSNVIKERLSRKKVFIVLDDVNAEKQLETLAYEHDWFGPGSRIIITTRDQRLLITHGVNYLYKVEGLPDNEAFQLFSQYAFKQDMQTSDYLKLVDQFVSYAKGLPLALKVLGSFLHRKSIDEWVSELNKLKIIPHITIQDVLRSSFDGLDVNQKDVFLDIACFFKYEKKDFVIAILKSCGLFPESELRVLQEKSLITINSYNSILVHDLLQEMGWEVVRQQSIEEPGKRSRLWLSEDICHIFKHNTGTRAVKGIFLDITKIEKVQLSREAFCQMKNLRLLKIYDSRCYGRYYGYPLEDNIKVCLPQGLEGLSDELRYLHWHGYPLKCLPCNFEPKNLVELHMLFSNLKQPWEGKKDMQKLKVLVLSRSHNLKDIRDLSLAQNLELIDLEGCISLHEIDPSVQHFHKLTALNLKGCTSLESLAELPENIKCLHLDSTSISDFPQLQHSTQIVTLSLKDCKFLLNLPNWFSSLTSLTELTLSGCSKITKLPDNLGDMSSLVTLKAEGIGLNILPSSVSNLKSLETLLLNGSKGKDSGSLILPPLWGLHSLTQLGLSDCNLVEFPEDLVGLSSLYSLDLSKNNFERIDVNLEPLSKLKILDLRECKMLRSISMLPSNISKCETHSCDFLETISSSICRRDDLGIKNESYGSSLAFLNCFNLNQITLTGLMSDVLARLQVDAEATQDIVKLDPFVPYYGFKVDLFYPGSEIPEWLTHQNDGSSVSFQMQPPQMNSKLIGFIFCAVLESENCFHEDFYSLTCKIYLTKIDGLLETSFLFTPDHGSETFINADHVFIGYNVGFLASLGHDIYTNCVIEFSISDEYRFDFCDCKVKRCGGRPVYLVYCKEEEMWKFSIG